MVAKPIRKRPKPKIKEDDQMAKSKNKIALHKLLWCKIRLYQQLHDLTNQDLAAFIGVSERTLLEYDKDAKNITLGKLENFLLSEGLELDELLAS